MKTFIILIYWTASIACNVSNNPNHIKRDSLIDEKVGHNVQARLNVDTIPKEQQKKRAFKTSISDRSTIKIISAVKTIDTTSKFYEVYAKRCNSWRLTKRDVLYIIRSSKQIDGQEFHNFFEVLPCRYSGQLEVDGQPARYEINSGSFCTLFFKDTAVYLGYQHADFEKYFFVGPGTD